MYILSLAGLLLLFAAVIHFLMLKLEFIKFDKLIGSLLSTFISVLVIGIILSSVLHSRNEKEYLYLVLTYIPCMLTYIITWAALYGDSPSMSMVRYINMHGNEGCSKEDIKNIITDEALIFPRIKGMLESKWVAEKNERFYITRKGAVFNAVFASVLYVLNIKREG